MSDAVFCSSIFMRPVVTIPQFFPRPGPLILLCVKGPDDEPSLINWISVATHESLITAFTVLK